MIKALEYLLYEDRLLTFRLLSLENWKLRRVLIDVYGYLMGGSKMKGARLLKKQANFFFFFFLVSKVEHYQWIWKINHYLKITETKNNAT